MKKRYCLPDLIRGFAVVNMIAYHAMWDLFYIYRVAIPFFDGLPAYLWQQSICSCFILLSGFSFNFGGKSYKRGITVFLAGAIVSAVTLLVMPQNRIIFGVLTFLGIAMIIAKAVHCLADKVKPATGLFVSLTLFLLTKSVGSGFLGIGDLELIPLPGWLYNRYITALLGFPPSDFYSADYFPIFPWIFLFFAGFYLFSAVKDTKIMVFSEKSRCKALEFIGRHSLIIYLAHQPVIYLILIILFGGTQ